MPRDLLQLATDERRDLLDLVRTFGAEEWHAPSLCAGWRVLDVVAHLVSFDGTSAVALAGAFVRGRFSVDRVNELVLRPLADAGPDAVVAHLEHHLRPTGLTRGFGGAIGLTDGTIHHQDVRRALGLPRDVPHERLRPVLDFALRAPTLPARRHARGLRLVATDLDWTHGDGPEVHGPGEALLMSVAGRAQALEEVTGPGAGTLAGRVDA